MAILQLKHPDRAHLYQLLCQVSCDQVMIDPNISQQAVRGGGDRAEFCVILPDPLDTHHARRDLLQEAHKDA